MRVIRRYRFSASHRLHTDALTERENERVYGKCNNPFGHGHDYVLEIGICGPLDPETGLIIPIPALDRLVQQTVLQTFAHRNINVDIPVFRDLVPTTENIALVIAETIEQAWATFPEAGLARPDRIRIEETDRNSFEIVMEVAARKREEAACAEEEVHVHA